MTMFRDFFCRIYNRLVALREESGQTMAEYGVVLTVITVATVAVFVTLGDNVAGLVNFIAGQLKF